MQNNSFQLYAKNTAVFFTESWENQICPCWYGNSIIGVWDGHCGTHIEHNIIFLVLWVFEVRLLDVCTGYGTHSETLFHKGLLYN